MKTIGRFWSFVDRTGSSCWWWRGAIKSSGYGNLYWRGQFRMAHCVAFELASKTRIVFGQVVRHTCDNKTCCNPEHLRIGTQADNMADKVSRGRHLRGMTHPLRTLDQTQVDSIRSMSEQGTFQYQIAETFGVSQQQVSRIVNRKRWR